MKSIKAFVALACLVALPAVAAGDAKPKVVAFNASVKVEVDAVGKPVKVEAPADLPEAIRGFIEKRVASWQYEPAKIEGVPQPATTYVAVNACAVPEASGYRLGLDFGGNGVRTATDQRLIPPMYPPTAQRAGTEADFVLILGIEQDGHASIDKIEKANISGRPGASEFEPLLRRWVKTIRFDPEVVAGKPVRGQVRMPVDFTLRTFGNRKALIDELQAKAKTSRECQMAAGDDAGPKPIAMNPAVTVTPIPAS